MLCLLLIVLQLTVFIVYNFDFEGFYSPSYRHKRKGLNQVASIGVLIL